MKALDIIAIGTCYIDMNIDNFPFDKKKLLGEELIGERYETVPGGSAVNFCRLSANLGLRPAFIGMSGSDPNGNILEDLLTSQGVHTTLIKRPDVLTNISFNITNPDGEHIMFTAGTANAALNPENTLPALQKLLSSATILYLGGCLKLKAFVHAFKEITTLANQNSVRIAVDHGRVPQAVSKEMREAVKALVLDATYYFPSREEFCELWGVTDIEQGLRKLQSLAPELITVVKDGENGAFYMEHGVVRNIQASKVSTVINATGAGDSFNAGFIAAYQKGKSLPDAIMYGCNVAAAKIEAKPLPVL